VLVGVPALQSHATLTKGQFPRSDALLKRAVHLDVHPLFTEQDLGDIVTGIQKVARAVL